MWTVLPEWVWVCVFVCVQAGVLAEGSLKRLTSRAARIICVNRTIYNIYTQHIHRYTCQYLTFTSYTILQSETKQCCEAMFFLFLVFSFFNYINARMLFDVNPTILFGSQAQFLIMLPCVLEVHKVHNCDLALTQECLNQISDFVVLPSKHSIWENKTFETTSTSS